MGARLSNEQFEVPASTGAYMTTTERTYWKVEVARLNKELTAVRSHMDWQARRINELEMRLHTLGLGGSDGRASNSGS